MRNIIAFAAALAINIALVLVFQNSAEEAMPVPNGEVIVTELTADSVVTLAQAAGDNAQVAL